MVGAMLLFVMTFMTLFFNKGTKLCRQFTSNAYNNQQIVILKKKWRKFIHTQTDDGISCNSTGRSFSGKNRTVKIQNKSIIFSNKGKKQHYKISKNMNITFKIEANDDHKLAIMNIKITSPFPGGKDEIVRIVAVPGKQ